MNFFHYLLHRRRKNSNFQYYFQNILSYAVPNFLFRGRLSAELSRLSCYDRDYIADRVNYCNKLEDRQSIAKNAIRVKDFRFHFKKYTPHAYFFDTYKYTRFFPAANKMAVLFGDTTRIPDCPSLVKSRPVEGANENSVMLNLDKLRHFIFVKDQMRFQDKKDMLIGRCAIYQRHRIEFWNMYFGHALCDLGQVNKQPAYNNGEWVVPWLPIDAHLRYKFILALEGNDVASNLKWIMSSNSLAVMPRPTYETWFMEGTLIPDYHYVEIKKDYSDLPEKLHYYINNTGEALKILDNAHRYVEQFKDERREKLISLLVLQKYFEHAKWV